MYLQIIYIWCIWMYKQDLALNNLQGFVFDKNQPINLFLSWVIKHIHFSTVIYFQGFQKKQTKIGLLCSDVLSRFCPNIKFDY